MADQFVELDLPLDAEDIREEQILAMQSHWEDWTPADSNLETWILDGVARINGETNELIRTVAASVFRSFGEKVVGLPVQDGAPATAAATVTFIDSQGYTLEEGTEIGLPAAGDDLIVFVVTRDVVVSPGSVSTVPEGVPLTAVEVGEIGNELNTNAEMISRLDAVTSVVVPNPSADGEDPETSIEYLDRLARHMKLMSGHLITVEDYIDSAKNFEGVERAMAVDLWKPSTGEVNQERYIGVVAIDEDGADVSAVLKASMLAHFNAKRETNFVPEIGTPTYNVVDAVAAVGAYPDFDSEAVRANVAETLASHLSPARWGRATYGTAAHSWDNSPKVLFLDVSTVIRNVPGVMRVDSLTINGGTADITLNGIVPLTQPGIITVTVS